MARVSEEEAETALVADEDEPFPWWLPWVALMDGMSLTCPAWVSVISTFLVTPPGLSCSQSCHFLS